MALVAVPVSFRIDVSRVNLASIRQNHNAYRRREGDRGEAERAMASGKVDPDALLENDFLWADTRGAEGVTEEVLLSMRSLVSAVCYEDPVSKKGYLKLLRSLVGDVQSWLRECEVTTRQLDERGVKVNELELKVRLPVDGARHIVELKWHLYSQAVELALAKKALGTKKIALEEKVCQYDRLELELSAVRDALGRGEGFMRDFVERACTCYTLLAHA